MTYSFRLIVREFGAKNAKLICIKDETSYHEPVFVEAEQLADTNKAEEKQCLITKLRNEPVRVSSETQTEIVTTSVESKNKMNVKISRLPKKSMHPLELLPKELIFAVAQYKLTLYDYNKANCLYMRSAVTKPWLLMGQ